MANLGKYTLVKINDDVVAAQMDSSLSFSSGIIETTEISGANRFKTFEYEEKEAECTVNIQQSEAIESSLYNAWYNSTKISVWYGGINLGEKYYLFDAIITNISKSDPSVGISMLSVALKVSGIVQRLTVSEAGETWTLTLTYIGDGTVNKSPDKTNYEDGESVILTASPNSGSVFWKHLTGSALSGDNPLSLLMDSDKAISYIFGLDGLDYIFDAASAADWVWSPAAEAAFDYSFVDGVGVTISGSSIPSSILYQYFMTMELDNPVCFNRVKVYFDSTDFDFYVNLFNIYTSAASTGEIDEADEPYFSTVFSDIKYTDEISLLVSGLNLTSASLTITRIILDII